MKSQTGWDKVLEVIMPPLRILSSTKKIQLMIDEIRKAENIQESYSWKYPFAKLEDLEKLYYNGFGIKEKFEDKGKSTLFIITIVITLFIGFTSLLYNNSFMFAFSGLRIVSYILIALSLIYMLMSALLNLKLLSEKNVTYYLNASYFNETNMDRKKDSIGESIESNNLMNIIRNNYVSAAFQCIVNAIILFIVFIVIIFVNYQIVKTIENVNYLLLR